MKVSIVITGRNDDYGGGFKDRMFGTVNRNFAEFERYGIDCEYVFVEWNPPADRELLASELARRFQHASCYVVANDVHRHISENRHIELYEYYAKNVGAARATGDWLLVTNPDIAIGQDVLEFFASADLDESTLYRASFARIHEFSEVGVAEPIDLDQESPFFRHAGDFICCHRNLFNRVGGFREDLPFTNTHKDSLFLRSAVAQAIRVRKIGTIYHFEHERFNHNRRRIEFDVDRVEVTPQTKFGSFDICQEAPLAERVVELTLREDLQFAAMHKELPEPVVPRHLRRQRGFIRRLRKTFRRSA